MRYAIIENGVVVNVTEGAKLDNSWVSCDEFVSIGYAYASGVFTAPIPSVVEEPEVIPTWLIAVGAFYDRFGAYKIPILASDDAVVQAMVKDAQVRKHIDLQRSDLPMMLDLLISKGFAVDKDAILSTSAANHELP